MMILVIFARLRHVFFFSCMFLVHLSTVLSSVAPSIQPEATMIVGYEFGHRWSEKQRQEVNFARPEQFARHPELEGKGSVLRFPSAFDFEHPFPHHFPNLPRQMLWMSDLDHKFSKKIPRGKIWKDMEKTMRKTSISPNFPNQGTSSPPRRAARCCCGACAWSGSATPGRFWPPMSSVARCSAMRSMSSWSRMSPWKRPPETNRLVV